MFFISLLGQGGCIWSSFRRAPRFRFPVTHLAQAWSPGVDLRRQAACVPARCCSECISFLPSSVRLSSAPSSPRLAVSRHTGVTGLTVPHDIHFSHVLLSLPDNLSAPAFPHCACLLAIIVLLLHAALFFRSPVLLTYQLPSISFPILICPWPSAGWVPNFPLICLRLE